MKYYDMIVRSCSIKTHWLTLNTKDPEIIDFLDTKKYELVEPVEVEAFEYNTDDREDDYVCAGNPQIVSEKFKNLVEELDPNAAQFFTTKCVNCAPKTKYYLMHVTQVISCLDREHSKFLPGIGEEKESIAVGAVDVSRIPADVHLFRLAEDTSIHYVSEKFYKEYKKRKLRGCEFTLQSVEK